MSKAADMAKISAKGSFHMLWGLAASTVISAVGTILISMLLGEDNYGLYAVALMAPNLIVLFRDWGVNSAMVRYTAQYNAEDAREKIKGIFISGLIFEIVVGIVLSFVGLLLSNFLAAEVFNRPTVGPLIQIASFTVLTGALIAVATAAFTGIEKMHLNSIMIVAQSIIKTALIIALLVLGFGTFGAITGFAVSALFAGIIGLLLLWTIYRNLTKPANGRLEIAKNTRIMLRYGIPLSIGAVISGFLLQYYNFLMANTVTNNALIGNFAIAQNFVVLITFFAQPVTTMMFPAFSKLDVTRDHETLKNVFQFSVKYASLLVVPATAMIMVLAQPAISTIYRNSYLEAPLYLALLAITYLYTAFGNLSLGNIINSQGHTTVNLKLSLLTAAVGFPMGYIMITNFGILGLIVTTLTTQIPGMVLSLIFIKKRYHMGLNWASSAKILLSSAIAASITYIAITVLSGFAQPIRLIVGVIVFTIAYVGAAALTKTIDHGDINNLSNMLTGLGPIGKVLNVVLKIIAKLIPRSNNSKKT